MIMKGRAPLRLPWAGLFAIALMAATTLPAWATGGQQPPQAPQAPRSVAPQQPAPAQAATPKPPAPSPAARATTPSTPVPAQAAKPSTPSPASRVTTAIAPASPQTPRPSPAQDVKVAVPRPVKISGAMAQGRFTLFHDGSQLPEDGQKLLKTFDSDRDAIQQEADRKVEARKEALMKELQALQDQYAKSGKLDEAVAIRDYIRGGGPNSLFHGVLIKKR